MQTRILIFTYLSICTKELYYIGLVSCATGRSQNGSIMIPVAIYYRHVRFYYYTIYKQKSKSVEKSV